MSTRRSRTTQQGDGDRNLDWCSNCDRSLLLSGQNANQSNKVSATTISSSHQMFHKPDETKELEDVDVPTRLEASLVHHTLSRPPSLREGELEVEVR